MAAAAIIAAPAALADGEYCEYAAEKICVHAVGKKLVVDKVFAIWTTAPTNADKDGAKSVRFRHRRAGSVVKTWDSADKVYWGDEGKNKDNLVGVKSLKSYRGFKHGDKLCVQFTYKQGKNWEPCVTIKK